MKTQGRLNPGSLSAAERSSFRAVHSLHATRKNRTIYMSEFPALTSFGPRPEFLLIRGRTMIQPLRRRCPKCDRKDAQLVRKHDQYAKGSWRMTAMPDARVFTFFCKCGCQFTASVRYDVRAPGRAIPIFRLSKRLPHASPTPAPGQLPMQGKNRDAAKEF
jgi:hypothetical protein